MESFHFDYVRLRPEEQIGLHTQPSWEISYIVRGRGRRTLGDHVESFEAGEIVLVPPETPHEWRFDDSEKMIENITLIFSTDFLLLVGSQFPEMSAVIDTIVKLSAPVCFTRRTLHELHHLMDGLVDADPPARLVSVLSILRLVALSDDCRAVGQQAPSDKAGWLKEVEVYISCNHRHNVTIDLVAAHMGMNRSAFCTRFKRETGQTFINYLNDYRLGIARRLLAKGGMKVSEVCYQSGFNDVPYFNRLFKSRFHVSPGQFRESTRQQ
ncbi:MAG: AraC family transcriptional regulator [Prevotella sp.]|jgi:AraC-like DNA-binding protein